MKIWTQNRKQLRIRHVVFRSHPNRRGIYINHPNRFVMVTIEITNYNRHSNNDYCTVKL